MKPRPQQPRDRAIKLIHVARRELAMDDDTYRAMLDLVAGVKSAADLDAAGCQKVIDHMKAKGFKVKSKGAAVPGAKATEPDPQYRKIQALWGELERKGLVRVNTDAAIRVYIKRITGCDDYRFCNSKQVAVIIETLKKWRDRVEKPSDQVPVTEPESPHG